MLKDIQNWGDSPPKHILLPSGEYFYDEKRKGYFTADDRQLTEEDLCKDWNCTSADLAEFNEVEHALVLGIPTEYGSAEVEVGRVEEGVSITVFLPLGRRWRYPVDGYTATLDKEGAVSLVEAIQKMLHLK